MLEQNEQQLEKKQKIKYLALGSIGVIVVITLFFFLGKRDMIMNETLSLANLFSREENVLIVACTPIVLAGYYELANSITATTSPCIDIQANNVILDGKGFTITDGNPNVYNLVGGTGRNNVSVLNINLYDGTDGISFSSTSNLTIANVSTRGNFGSGIGGADNTNNKLYNITSSDPISYSGNNNTFTKINVSTGGIYPNALYLNGDNNFIGESSFITGEADNNAINMGYEGVVWTIDNLTMQNVVASSMGTSTGANFALLINYGNNVKITNFTSNFASVCASLLGENFNIENFVCRNSTNYGIKLYTNNSLIRNMTVDNLKGGDAIRIMRPNITMMNTLVNNTANGYGVLLIDSWDRIYLKTIRILNHTSLWTSQLTYAVGSGNSSNRLKEENYHVWNYSFIGDVGNNVTFRYANDTSNLTEIAFTERINGSGTNLTREVFTAQINFTEVTAPNGMKRKANITFWNVPNYTSANILKNNSLCIDCTNFTALNANPVVFNISSWSNYTINGTTSAAPPANDTCTYAGSGNWLVACSDNCTITTNVNLQNNNITILGSGLFHVKANITNYNKRTIGNGTSPNMCIIRRSNGGGFKS